MADEDNEIDVEVVAPPKGAGARLRTYFFTGILVTAPAAITFYIAILLINFVDAKVGKLIPPEFHPDNYLPFSVPGLGVIILVVGLIFIGMFAAGFLGKFLTRIWDKIIERMPFISSLYGALKQILETVLATQSTAFREVVLVEYPRKDMWVIGFITGTTKGEVQRVTDDEVVNIFLPTTPNPTSGFLLFVPKKDIIRLKMTVEEGLKLVISGGIVSPKDPKAIPKETAPQSAK